MVKRKTSDLVNELTHDGLPSLDTKLKVVIGRVAFVAFVLGFLLGATIASGITIL